MTADETGPAEAGPIPDPLRPRRRQWMAFAARMAVTIILLVVLFAKLDVTESLELFTPALVPILLAGLVIAFLTILLNAMRWAMMVRLTESALGFRASLSITLLGHFFNQLLPTSVGGDLVRGWEATRSGIRPRDAVISIVLDRLAGLVALLLLIIIGQPFLIARLENQAVAAVAVILPLAAFAGLAAVWFLNRLPLAKIRLPFVTGLAELSRAAQRLVRAPGAGLYTLGLSLGIHSLALFMTTLYAQALGAQVGFADMLFVVPTVLLVSSLPISIAGWGVREAGLAAGFAALGHPASVAVTVSILVGLTNAAVGLPGAVVWVLRRRRAAAAARPDGQLRVRT